MKPFLIWPEWKSNQSFFLSCWLGWYNFFEFCLRKYLVLFLKLCSKDFVLRLGNCFFANEIYSSILKVRIAIKTAMKINNFQFLTIKYFYKSGDGRGQHSFSIN